MDQEQAPQKRRGRPPKVVERPKNASFTFRLLPDLRQKLEASAAARSVSMSEEIERRLEHSFRNASDPYLDTALRMAEANCSAIQAHFGKGIAEDEFVRSSCAKAASTAIELVGGLSAPESRDTPEARALLQADATTFGQAHALFVKLLVDGASRDAVDGVRDILEQMLERRRAEIAERDRVYRQTLARLLRDGAQPAPGAQQDEPELPLVDEAAPPVQAAAPPEVAPKRRGRPRKIASGE